MTQKPNLPSQLLTHFPWGGEKNPIWLSSSLILLRNLSRSKFPTKQKEAELKSTQEHLQKALTTAPSLKNLVYLPADLLDPLEREWIYEHFLTHDSFQNIASGQGFALDDSGRLLGTINIENHLSLQIIDTSQDIAAAWGRLAKIEAEISKSAEFAFSPKFGYLTADPSQCGTGLLGYLYLHLPALHHTGQLQELIQNQIDEDVRAMGLEGSLEDLVGDIVIIRNPYTLGLTEETIIHSLESAALKLIAAERTLRSHLREKEITTIKDQIGRAFGLLAHSYQLHAKESLNALSLLKLGADLGWVTGITQDKLSEVFFQCRRAHLSHLLGKAASEDLLLKRAEFIHNILHQIQLK